MNNLWIWCQGLGLATATAIVFSGNSAIAQITEDVTLPTNSQVEKQGNAITIITGGTLSQDGSNLFHSFKEFSVLPGTTAEFRNTESVQNIISRVTGKSVSNIEGIIKAKYKANLFLINPNGIIFGNNASLEIGGSFVASTASSLNFTNGTKFSATDPQTPPLLTVSVPNGLQFGTTAAPIRNKSQASSLYSDKTNVTINIFKQPVGLQVQQGKTLALVGGDITLEGGNLTAASGRIELGSVASNSLVSLKSTDQGWVLGYQGTQKFQNIQLLHPTVNGSDISSPSTVDVSGKGGGSIQVQANSIELIGDSVSLISQTTGDQDGEDITISSGKLIVQDGAQVLTSTTGQRGKGGNLSINASESVALIGNSTTPDGTIFSSGIFSTTAGGGRAGDITINTKRLRIQDGATISTESSGTPSMSQFRAATGNAGNLTINASESVEIKGKPKIGDPSSIFASTLGSGNAGQITISTQKLIIEDKAVINVNSQLLKSLMYEGGVPNLGSAGNLTVSAGFILLDTNGKLTSDSQSGQGGNISLQVRDLLLMRGNSQISTNAEGEKTGGNITINAPNGFLVATPLENNDITANANFGSGGKITITAKSIFGFVPRTRTDLEKLLNTKDPDQLKPTELPTSDITAFSQQNPILNGTIQINSPNVDPSKGLVELPTNMVDASQQIVAACDSGGKIGRSSFITTGRGGLVADPTQPLIADDAVLADWITLSPESKNRAGVIQKKVAVQPQQNTEEKSQKVNSVNEPTQIVEAQGWVIDANGNVVLVAQVPTASPHNSLLTATSCAAN
ncbi:filamentous hemagglutinin N-terminal domain-containing protein [uncultured Nostoc sp.]|uniref:filamentous hemagglutinin N-terminal domain-containing protein n=1 Tax=uncultured Nostoc sp. TaxID=340711 RepID=UPI0035CAEF24